MTQDVTITPVTSTPVDEDKVNSNKNTKTPIIQHKVKRRILLFG
jgi:hypothetical protein